MKRKGLALLIWVLSLAGTIWLFFVVPKGFLPVGDSGMIRGVYLAAEGTSPAQMQAYQRRLTEIAEAEPGVDQVITVTGLQNNQLTTSMGLFIVLLKPEGQRAPIAEITQRITEKVRQQVPGVIPLLQPYPTLNIDTGATSNTQGAFAYQLTSTDPELLYKTAGALVERLQKDRRISSVSRATCAMNTPIQELEILRDQAYSYGVNVQDIESTLAIAFAQGMGRQIQTPLNVYWVILELLDNQRARLDYLNLLWVRNQQGEPRSARLAGAAARQDRSGIDQPHQSDHLGDNLLQS